MFSLNTQQQIVLPSTLSQWVSRLSAAKFCGNARTELPWKWARAISYAEPGSADRVLVVFQLAGYRARQVSRQDVLAVLSAIFIDCVDVSRLCRVVLSPRLCANWFYTHCLKSAPSVNNATSFPTARGRISAARLVHRYVKRIQLYFPFPNTKQNE